MAFSSADPLDFIKKFSYFRFFFFLYSVVICSVKIDRKKTDVNKLSSGTWQHSKMLPVIMLWAIETRFFFYLCLCVCV